MWVPPTAEKGFWLATGVAALLLGNLLVTPFFVNPANALSYCTTVLIAIALTRPQAATYDQNVLFFLFAYSLGGILLLGFIGILVKDSAIRQFSALSQSSRVILEQLAGPRVLFPAVTIYAILQFHMDSVQETIGLAIAGLLISALKPVEALDQLVLRVRFFWRSEPVLQPIAELVAHQAPNALLLRQAEQSISPGDLLAVNDPHEDPKAAMTIGVAGRQDGILVRAVELPSDAPQMLEVLRGLLEHIPAGFAARLPASLAEKWASIPIVKSWDKLIGFVAPGTSVTSLLVDLLPGTSLEVGQLLSVVVGEQDVLFQVINCEVREERVYQKNTFAFWRATARKIGSWLPGEGSYRHVPWLPEANAWVFSAPSVQLPRNEHVVGYFPNSGYSVEVQDIDKLVTHHTAILGILGIGKTYLAIELVERMLAAGVHVVCLDLTEQYQDQLADFYDLEYERECLIRLREAADQDAEVDENPEEGGSLPQLKSALYDDLSAFLADDERFLKIYNPAKLHATRQLQELKSVKEQTGWKRRAALWNASPVEITRVIAEALLEIASNEFRSRAHVCLVLEEAHALVPEWNTVAEKRDQEATAGTARAILQGRKFGFGCLVVSQRTANVTKTILNQCNTIFAMRSFDDTSKNFLANYIGGEYAGALPKLTERQAVFFGPSSSCEDPVLLRLNDREDFLGAFRSKPGPCDFSGEGEVEDEESCKNA